MLLPKILDSHRHEESHSGEKDSFISHLAAKDFVSTGQTTQSKKGQFLIKSYCENTAKSTCSPQSFISLIQNLFIRRCNYDIRRWPR